MPFRKDRNLRRGLLALAGALTVALAGAGPASAATCAATPSAQHFLKWNDLAWYSLAPGGSFEGTTTAWTLNGARLVADNETHAVTGAGRQSLEIPAGSAGAVSPAFCVDTARPHFRFFAKESVPGSGSLLTSLRFTNPNNGRLQTITVNNLDSGKYGAWQPTPVVDLATALPITAGQTISVRLVFQPVKAAKGWRVDDVLVDPYRS